MPQRQFRLECESAGPEAAPTFYGIVAADDVDYAMMLIMAREYLAPNGISIDSTHLVFENEAEVSTVVEYEEAADNSAQVVLELRTADDGARSLTARRVDFERRYWFGVWPYEERNERTPLKVTAEPLWRFGALPDWSDRELELADGLEVLFADLRGAGETEEG